MTGKDESRESNIQLAHKCIRMHIAQKTGEHGMNSWQCAVNSPSAATKCMELMEFYSVFTLKQREYIYPEEWLTCMLPLGIAASCNFTPSWRVATTPPQSGSGHRRGRHRHGHHLCGRRWLSSVCTGVWETPGKHPRSEQCRLHG